MQIILSNLHPPARPAGPPKPQKMSKKPDPSGQTQRNVGDGFRISDLGFFHSDLEESYDIKDIVFNNKETIYREMYFFYRRIKDYVMIKGKDIVRINLSIYFQESVLS